MELLGFLIVFPFIAGAILFVVHNDKARDIIVCASALIIAVTSVYLVAGNIGAPLTCYEFSSHAVDYICSAAGVVIAAIILYFGIKFKNTLACILAAVQIAGALVFEFGFAHGLEVENGLYFDSLSLIMAAIIGVIGSGICLYALGYMKDFQAHEPADAKDRRPFFFGIMFIFLGAMFLIVFSNNMVWLFTGWEITTVSSFLLIGFTRTEEAIANSFRQINMNLLGGIGFVVALFFIALNFQTLALDEFISLGVANAALVAVPAIALGFSGITKAAQMPFQTWLLGAMVAPTPTSALLHSSTMVKAGVFLLIKLAPIYLVCPAAQTMVVLVGGITFMLCSFMAISQTNAKRVLAYSTIANLGLIVSCAGVGTPEAVWAGTFLIIFHAVAKSLLFLCVGTAEHHIGSRDIEDMDLMFERMPRLARFMMLGIMCMFIVPFGMLIAKWATLVSFADHNMIALLILLAFGSGATFMFWAKWLGKLSGIAARPENVELTVHRSEWAAIMTMVVSLILCCIELPSISNWLVEPYLQSVYGLSVQNISDGNLWIAAILVAFICIVLFTGLGRNKYPKAEVYMAGISVSNEGRTFKNSLSGETEATARNWYLEDYFGETRIAPVGELACIIIMGLAFVVACVMLVM